MSTKNKLFARIIKTNIVIIAGKAGLFGHLEAYLTSEYYRSVLFVKIFAKYIIILFYTNYTVSSIYIVSQ